MNLFLVAALFAFVARVVQVLYTNYWSHLYG